MVINKPMEGTGGQGASWNLNLLCFNMLYPNTEL